MLAGCVVDRLPGAKYTATLRFAELDLRAPLPRIETLKQFGGRLPEGFVTALRAPRAAVVSTRGPLIPDTELERALDWTRQAVEALDAVALVVSTPAQLSPGARGRRLLEQYAERLPPGIHRVWAPGGSWEPEQAAAVCAELGLVCAFDPLAEPHPGGEVVYARLRALGQRRAFADGALHDVIDLLRPGTPAEIYVAIDSPRSFREAQRLTALAAG